MRFHFKAEDGKIVFTPYNRARFIEYLKANDGRDFFTEMTKKPMSEDIREWYWAAIVPMVRSLIPQWHGMADEAVHEA